MTKPENPADVDDGAAGPGGSGGRIRFDKWLWAARFYKTRSLAAKAIEAGQARLNEARVKPAHGVRAGDTVMVRKQATVWAVLVTAITDRRGSAAAAAELYRESAGSLALRTEQALQRKAAAATAPTFTGRPTKRNRRKLADFLNEP